MGESTVLSLRIPNRLRLDLEKAAMELDITRSKLVQSAITNEIARLKAYEEIDLDPLDPDVRFKHMQFMNERALLATHRGVILGDEIHYTEG